MLQALFTLAKEVAQERIKKKKKHIGAIQNAFDLMKQGQYGEAFKQYGKYKFGEYK